MWHLWRISISRLRLRVTLLVCSSLGDVYGVPKLLYKGQHGDFFVMVRAACPLHAAAVLVPVLSGA